MRVVVCRTIAVAVVMIVTWKVYMVVIMRWIAWPLLQVVFFGCHVPNIKRHKNKRVPNWHP